MCTIVLLHHVHPELPLVVAANRDEFYARESEAPRVLAEAPRVVGGVNRAGAGTWMGAAETGLFVGITNQRTGRPADRSLRSRGEVVLGALRAGSVAGVGALVEALTPAAYNPFNLVFGDGEALRVAYVRPDGVTVADLNAGVHVLANDRLGSVHFPRAARAAELTAAVPTAPWEALAAGLGAMLADHALPPPGAIPPAPAGSLMPRWLLRRHQALCIHTPLYGTVSSTLLALGKTGRVARYLYAPGPPCRAPYGDVTGLYERS